MTTKDFQKLHDDMIAFRDKGEFDKLAELFTEDCCVMTPMHDPFTKKQMVEFHTKGAKAPETKVQKTIHCDSATLSGDLAVERGTMTITLPTGKKDGYYLCVWRKEGGKWKVFNMCFGAKKE